jgi:hypothetical protein
MKTTSNNGYLGSRNDEDRSEFRYVMRIAELVNHQNVERKLHFPIGEVFLFECVLTLLVFYSFIGDSFWGALVVFFKKKDYCPEESTMNKDVKIC